MNKYVSLSRCPQETPDSDGFFEALSPEFALEGGQQMTQDIREHWNQRAALGNKAGTHDLIAKELEHRAILAEVRRLKPSTVLEIGCGRGELAREVVQAVGSDYLAVDNARDMIAAAKSQWHDPRLHFMVADLLPVGHFDCVITERMLINLPTWKAQREHIDGIAERLNPGGHYLMCENSAYGLQAINAGRAALGLEVIQAPWHNRYLYDEELASVDSLELVECQPFSATYYFLSRVVNAALAHDAGQSPAYDAPINRLALSLPAHGPYAQGRLWIWQKR